MKDDLNARTYKDLIDKAPVGYIDIGIGKVVKGENGWETRWDEYAGAVTIIMSVYECDEKTTAFLQSIGINTDTSIPADKVSKVEELLEHKKSRAGSSVRAWQRGYGGCIPDGSTLEYIRG